uniref:Uncharacterized protein n=1 Tax=Romanomermis culicivorax TaxID=13658 RepID=A0A915K5S0_ROMCU
MALIKSGSDGVGLTRWSVGDYDDHQGCHSSHRNNRNGLDCKNYSSHNSSPFAIDTEGSQSSWLQSCDANMMYRCGLGMAKVGWFWAVAPAGLQQLVALNQWVGPS